MELRIKPGAQFMAEIEGDAHIASPDSLCNPHNIFEAGQVKTVVWIERDAKVGSRGQIGDSIDCLDRSIFCSRAGPSVTHGNGDPDDSSPPFQGLDRIFHPWLIFHLTVADVHRQPKEEQLEMGLVQGLQALGDLLGMIEDSALKSIVARKSGLLRGRDIAKLVRKDWVWQAGSGSAVEPSRVHRGKCDARGCSTFDKSPTSCSHHAGISSTV